MSRSVVLARTPVSGSTPIIGTFVPLKPGGNISLMLICDGTVDASWTILASNKMGVDVTGDAEASDITAAFKTGSNAAIPAVSHLTPATQSIYCQAGPVFAGAISVKVTPTAGAGNVSAFLNDAS